MRTFHSRRSVRRALSIASVIALVCIIDSVGAAGAGAAPGSAWSIAQTSMPTRLVPGTSAPETELARNTFPQYNLTIVNMGAAPTQGTVTVSDALPEGLAPAEGTLPAIRNIAVEGEAQTCPEPVGRTVVCTVTASVPAGAALYLAIPLAVSNAAGGSVINEVTISGGGAATVTSSESTEVGQGSLPFGLIHGQQGLSAKASQESGDPETQAGSHPYALTLEAGIPTEEIAGTPLTERVLPVESLKTLAFSLPQGVVFNPKATSVRCTETQLISAATTGGEGCPLETQVGEVILRSPAAGLSLNTVPLYNVVPPAGSPAELGFNALGTVVHIQGGLGGNFHLTAESHDILAKIFTSNVQAVLWGSPSDSSHDPLRSGAGGSELCQFSASSRLEATGELVDCGVRHLETPLLTMPSSCSGPVQLEAGVGSWSEPVGSSLHTGLANLTGPSGVPIEPSGCSALSFKPKAELKNSSSSTSSPSGLSVNIEVPQSEGVNTLATANLKKAVVRLPQGVTVSPSAADGLGSCSVAAVGLGTNDPAQCPDASRVGGVEITTPLLESPLAGSIYLAEQRNNPFGTLLALYLVAEGEGVVIKLPGRVDADAVTGQLTATFDNNPELPFSDLEVNFNSGPRATLATPSSCGIFGAETELVAWSGAEAKTQSPLTVNQNCATGGFKPGFEAGTANPVAGRFSAFTLRVTRADGEANISMIQAGLPEGLLAKLAGIPLCSDAGAADGSCPTSSQVGTTTTGIGVGTQPLFVPQAGKSPTAVYLAGPYRGAPYSLVVKVPAQAGPFDLGTIAVRVALNVDPFTAQVTASSDPLPQILEGIPIAYRDIRVEVLRPEFIVNPTSCEPKQITSLIGSTSGATAIPSARFQVAGCQSLKFKPMLKLGLEGATKRTGHPALKAVVTYPKKGSFANIRRAQVNLPHSEFLDQGNIAKACTKVILAQRACPARSIYGKAKAWSPLLEKPLEGPVYLVGGYGYKLPALVAELDGQIRVLLVGKVDSGKNHGIRNTFEAVPDAPVSRFVLELKGGKKYGLLENSEDVCRKTQKAGVSFRAQNGKVLQSTVKISNSCGHKDRKHGAGGKAKKKKRSSNR